MSNQAGKSIPTFPRQLEEILLAGKDHLYFLKLALDEAEKCPPTPTAYCVGCVLVVPPQNIDYSEEPIILATGYTLELPGNTHAEANALSKAKNLSPDALAALFPNAPSPPTLDYLLSRTDVYTTMEPCSVRLSGLSPCAQALIAAKIRRCIIGVGEPADFVNCEGARMLENAGIEVIWVQGLEDKCLAVARKGHGSVKG
jgi:pyrimidine deaminase RibD-like protein